MKTPSRMMEPLRTDQKIGAVGWSVAIVLLGVVTVLVIYSPEWRLAFGLLGVAVVVLGIVSHIHSGANAEGAGW